MFSCPPATTTWALPRMICSAATSDNAPPMPDLPPDPPPAADERATLEAFLDYYRGVIVRKVSGLSFEDATRSTVPSGTNLLSMVRHLGWVETGWFREIFAGEDVGDPGPPEAPDTEDADFRVMPGETVESIVAFYREEIERARAIVAAAPSLDELSKRSTRRRGQVSLRWILVHMIEETARHAGHADIIREQIDGATGD